MTRQEAKLLITSCIIGQYHLDSLVMAIDKIYDDFDSGAYAEQRNRELIANPDKEKQKRGKELLLKMIEQLKFTRRYKHLVQLGFS